jgi:hypothetical protein
MTLRKGFLVLLLNGFLACLWPDATGAAVLHLQPVGVVPAASPKASLPPGVLAVVFLGVLWIFAGLFGARHPLADRRPPGRKLVCAQRLRGRAHYRYLSPRPFTLLELVAFWSLSSACASELLCPTFPNITRNWTVSPRGHLRLPPRCRWSLYSECAYRAFRWRGHSTPRASLPPRPTLPSLSRPSPPCPTPRPPRRAPPPPRPPHPTRHRRLHATSRSAGTAPPLLPRRRPPTSSYLRLLAPC